MPKECKDKSEPPAILVLGPFQPQTRLKFETDLYEEASTKLIIKNPTNRVSHVSISHLIIFLVKLLYLYYLTNLEYFLKFFLG